MLTLEKKTLKKERKEIGMRSRYAAKNRTRREQDLNGKEKLELVIHHGAIVISRHQYVSYMLPHIYWLYVLLFRVCEPFVPLQITVTNGSKRPVICNKGLASERRRQDDWSRTGDQDGPDEGACPKVWSEL